MQPSARRVGVLVGGGSSESDASVRAGDAVVRVLREAGHDAVPVFVDREVDLALRQLGIETAFLSLRPAAGADGRIQGLLESLAIPYTGSGALAAGLAAHGARLKEMLRLANLPVAPGYVVREDTRDDLAGRHGSLGFPVLVRAIGSGSASAVAWDESDLEALVDEALQIGDEVLVERHVDGRCFAVAVLDGVALGAAEVPAPHPAVADAATGVTPRAPAPRGRLSSARQRSLLRLATAAYEALGCAGFASVSLLRPERHNEVIAAVDPAPLLAPGEPLVRLVAAAGLSLGELALHLLGGARLQRTPRGPLVAGGIGGHERRTAAASPAQ